MTPEFEIGLLGCKRLHTNLKSKIKASINTRIERRGLMIRIVNGDFNYEQFIPNWIDTILENNGNLDSVTETIIRDYRYQILSRYFY